MRWEKEQTWVLVLGALLGAVAPSACFDFGSVSNGAPDGGTNDGSSMVGSDAGDGGPTGDGATSGGDGGFCASMSTQPLYCNDFDEANSAGTWTQIPQVSATAAVSTTSTSPMPVSAPGLFLTKTIASDAGPLTEADGIRAFTTYAATKIHLTASFDMYIAEWDPSAMGQIIAFEVVFKNSPMTFNQIVINLNSLGPSGVSAQVAESAQGADGGLAGYGSYPFNDSPMTGQWMTVQFDLVIATPDSAVSNSVSVTVNGTTEVSQQALTVALQNGPPYVHLGIGYVSNPDAAWSVLYDNFTLNITDL